MNESAQLKQTYGRERRKTQKAAQQLLSAAPQSQGKGARSSIKPITIGAMAPPAAPQSPQRRRRPPPAPARARAPPSRARAPPAPPEETQAVRARHIACYLARVRDRRFPTSIGRRLCSITSWIVEIVLLVLAGYRQLVAGSSASWLQWLRSLRAGSASARARALFRPRPRMSCISKKSWPTHSNNTNTQQQHHKK